jgi:hypothetical protein
MCATIDSLQSGDRYLMEDISLWSKYPRVGVYEGFLSPG